jgi:hypothetical protein
LDLGWGLLVGFILGFGGVMGCLGFVLGFILRFIFLENLNLISFILFMLGHLILGYDLKNLEAFYFFQLFAISYSSLSL